MAACVRINQMHNGFSLQPPMSHAESPIKVQHCMPLISTLHWHPFFNPIIKEVPMIWRSDWCIHPDIYQITVKQQQLWYKSHLSGQ